MTMVSRLRTSAAAFLAAIVVAVGLMALAPASAQAASVSCTLSAPKTVRQGDYGSCVKLLQQRLGGVAVDGQFGPATLRAVKYYQGVKGLTVDGIVGPNTWNKLKTRTAQGAVLYGVSNISWYGCRNSANTAVKFSVGNSIGYSLNQVEISTSSGSGTYVDYIANRTIKTQQYYQAMGSHPIFTRMDIWRYASSGHTVRSVTIDFYRGNLPVC